MSSGVHIVLLGMKNMYILWRKCDHQVRWELFVTYKVIKFSDEISKEIYKRGMRFEMTRKEIINHINKTYKVKPEYLFDAGKTKDLKAVVFRRKSSNKWFGIIMNIKSDKVGIKSGTNIDVLNVKLDPDFVSMIKNTKGFYPAYHMNKTHWVSIIIDKVKDTKIMDLIKMSYENVEG